MGDIGFIFPDTYFSFFLFFLFFFTSGSPNYAAPELVAAVKYKGPAVDIWAMGVVL